MKCGRCSTEFDRAGACKCSTRWETGESEDERKDKILWRIVKIAAESDCHWSEIPDAMHLCATVGLKNEEVEKTLRNYVFSFMEPAFELSAIERKCIERLRATGLTVSRRGNGVYGHGFQIIKNSEVEGCNKRAGYDGLDDAPGSWIYPDADRNWYFEVRVFCPLPGPGDFCNEHGTLAAAVDDALDYYFGDPERMNPQPYAEHWERRAAEVKARNAKREQERK